MVKTAFDMKKAKENNLPFIKGCNLLPDFFLLLIFNPKQFGKNLTLLACLNSFIQTFIQQH
jgi:hypothetical protein